MRFRGEPSPPACPASRSNRRTMSEPTENLRRHPRFTVDVQANVSTVDGRKLIARTRDLSRSGICLVTSEDLGFGANLGIELVLLLGPSSSSEQIGRASCRGRE